MNHGYGDTVLLVCDCEATAPRILQRLQDAGFGVVGPVATAGLALALAAQALPTVAVVASPPAGRRKASALGRDLMSLWGIRSWVFDGAADDEAGEVDEAWAADPQAVQSLRGALRDLSTLGTAQ